MSTPPDDDEVGYGRPPHRARWKKGASGNSNRRYPKRSEGRLQMMTRLLLQPVEIKISGEAKKVSVLEVPEWWNQSDADLAGETP